MKSISSKYSHIKITMKTSCDYLNRMELKGKRSLVVLTKPSDLINTNAT